MVSKEALPGRADSTLPIGQKKKDEIHVVKIKRIPYGFFERQLWEYFTQFGRVKRVRVARSLKTGNFKGWAYVGFANKEVAEIAAETMNGYLMFEKRLSCHLMDPSKVPKSMKSGPRYVAPPHMRGRAKKEALRRNKNKDVVKEEKAKGRREAAFKSRLDKLKALGIDYDCDTLLPSKTASSTVKCGTERAEKKVKDKSKTSKKRLKKVRD
ncbi:hypothetical protein KIN20_025883 [Parelaphostrongylus tenuis]|uniref:RRM domain-containing protein n=1 Tax=Parelaphostrongylus tenuis TaxID=148309 RepID=A0AAD5MZY7_PARTN|nr:hypothetical protein KIN20_025883 [Parelaphostrongylus tenuis]